MRGNREVANIGWKRDFTVVDDICSEAGFKKFLGLYGVMGRIWEGHRVQWRNRCEGLGWARPTTMISRAKLR